MYNTSTGAYTGSANLGTIVGGTAPNGEYIFLDLPYVVTLKAVKIICRDPWSTEYDHAPVDWTLYGRASSSTWTQIQQFTNATYTEQVKTFNLTTAATGYDSFAIVVTKLGGGHNVILSEIEFVTNLPPSFSGTPPSTITFHTNGGWVGTYYWNKKTGATANSVRYQLYLSSTNTLHADAYGATFTINTNEELVLDVNDTVGGSLTPTQFKINGGTAVDGPHVVAANDDIELLNSSNATEAHFTVPSELAIKSPNKLGATTDVGEYIKIDLRSQIKLSSINLKSVYEYKEPIISMTDNSNYGYEVSSSSVYSSDYPAWKVFDGKQHSTVEDDESGWHMWISGAFYSTSGISGIGQRNIDFLSSQEYPEIALDSNNSHGFVTTASSNHTGREPWMAFNKIYEPGSDYWMCTSSGLYETDGSYKGPNSLGGVYGEWIAIEFPYYLKPASVHITARDTEGSSDRRAAAPKNFKVFGSNDGSTWTEILDQRDADIQDETNGGGTSFDLHTTTEYYKHFALVISATRTFRVDIAEIKYIGDIVKGEWIKIKLLDSRSLVSYKLAKFNDNDETPKVFSIYGSNDNSTWISIPGSSNTLTDLDQIDTNGTTYRLETPSQLYQYFCLVIEETFGGEIVRIGEWELFCKPSEIDEFKLYGSLDDYSWTEIHHETSVPTITSTGTKFQLLSASKLLERDLNIGTQYNWDSTTYTLTGTGAGDWHDTNYSFQTISNEYKDVSFKVINPGSRLWSVGLSSYPLSNDGYTLNNSDDVDVNAYINKEFYQFHVNGISSYTASSPLTSGSIDYIKVGGGSVDYFDDINLLSIITNQSENKVYFYSDGNLVKEYTTTHTGDWYICAQMCSNTTLQFTTLDDTIYYENYNYNKFGSDDIGQIGEGNPMVWTDISYWALDESNNHIIVAAFHSDYYSYIKVTLDGTYVKNSGKYEYTATSGQNDGVAPDAYTSQSQLVSDYYGGEYVDGSDRAFMKNTYFDSIYYTNPYQYYGLVIIKTKGYHNVSIGEMEAMEFNYQSVSSNFSSYQIKKMLDEPPIEITLTPNESFSFDYFVRLNEISETADYYIITQTISETQVHAINQLMYNVNYDGYEQKFVFQQPAQLEWDYNTGLSTNIGDWTHIAMTFDATATTSELKVFLNGIEYDGNGNAAFPNLSNSDWIKLILPAKARHGTAGADIDYIYNFHPNKILDSYEINLLKNYTQSQIDDIFNSSLNGSLASASSTSNLFTNTGFVSGNLINIGTIDQLHGGSATPLTLDYWAYNADDATVVIANHTNPYLRLLKIDLNGNNISESTERWHDVGASLTINSGSELINYWSTGDLHTSETTPFTKNASFDIIVNNSPAYYAFDDNATTQWVSQSNTYKPSTTVIYFSAYMGKTVEYAQADLSHHYGFLQPQFLVEIPEEPATSSTCYFADTTQYAPDAGGINYWHYTTEQPPCKLRMVADADGIMTIVYGALWHTTPVPAVYIEHTPSGGTTTSYSTTISKTTETFSVTKNDQIDIVETAGVLALYSISFNRSTEIGDYARHGFLGAPPTSINFHTSGKWIDDLYAGYTKIAESTNHVAYEFTFWGGNNSSGIIFEIDANHDLILDVNDATIGTNNPTYFVINGTTTVSSGRGVVSVGDDIQLYKDDDEDGGPLLAHINVPSELAVGLMRLAPTTDAGEYIKIDLGSAVEATTLTLKSVAEYKEPTISMTDYNQGGYEVTASSEYTGSNFKAWQVFDNLLTGDPYYGDAHDGNWVTAAGTYVLSGSDYVSKGTQLSASSSTVTGEWIKLKLLDKRKAVGYKLSRQNHTDYNRSPKQFRLYGSNDNSTWTEIVGSAQALTTTPLGSYDQPPEANGGTRFDFTASNAYQYFALVIEKCWGHDFTYVHEFQLFCQSEIDEFKLYGSLDDYSWTEILHETSVPAITSAGTNFQLVPSKFGSDNIGQIGESNPMVWTDVEYWALDESDNKIIVASFHSDYYSYIKVTLDGTYVENSGKYEYTAAHGGGVAPDAYTSQSQLVSDYYGGEYVDGSDRDFMKNSNFDGINVVNAYQYYGLVIIKTKGNHNVSICEMKIGNESKIAINF
jgi:hypothetical protein